ncbi:Bug family tripartite tricarboxylate transporter substrate binding protein [Falsiroseomonas oryzae]|uniref:Bug family tripartite tricarboxylate transporter substrate binding protein n=1 Tax=Falsiroseomonas oryzae TaxID=2766473 RepID=UPI0022EB3C7B|nr:tripartite tricarboxylate transporter substrate binding protein [Roseomonas sp. MO-31]
MPSLERRPLLAAALAMPALLHGRMASAQRAWPSRSVTIVVPYGPGGAADTVCRAVFARVADIVGQPVVVDNRTGGNTVIGSQHAFQQPHDGYTFLVNSSQLLVNPVLMTNLPLDFRTAFLPVTRLARFPQVLAVRRDFPAASLQEFIVHARQRPGAVNYGTPPGAGMGQMAGELLQARAGIRIQHVAYRLATDAAREVATGTLDAVILTTSTINPYLQGGRVRVLGVTSAERSPMLPDVPTFAEQGLPGFSMEDWSGLFAPSGVPQPVIARMQAVVAEAARDQAVIQRLSAVGSILVADEPAQFASWLNEQRTLLEQLIRDANITLS